MNATTNARTYDVFWGGRWVGTRTTSSQAKAIEPFVKLAVAHGDSEKNAREKLSAKAWKRSRRKPVRTHDEFGG